MRSYPLLPPIPLDTVRAAKAVYSQSNPYLSTGDRLALLLADIHLNTRPNRATRYHLMRPLLALVTVFQYVEKLSDRQAAEATNARVDWKYALHLSMNFPGLSPSVLCEFRQVLLCNPDQRMEFQRLLDRIREGNLVVGLEGKLVDAMRVLDEVCARTRLERVMTSVRNALQVLATRFPEWLRRNSLPYWYSRYQDVNRQPDLTQSMEQQLALAEAIGADILYLLEAVSREDSPELAALNEIQELQQVWREQFDPVCLDGVKLYPYCYFCGSGQQKEDCR